MTNSIKTFGLTENQIIRKNGEFFFSTKQIAQLLGTPINSVQKNIQNNKDEFGKVLVESHSTNTVGRPSMLLDEEQFYIYCMISRSEKARMLHREFAKMIKGIRSKEYIHISEYQNVVMQLDEAKDQLTTKRIEENVLSKIQPRKLNRYKKFRELGLSRKESCKALELPYRRMKEADKVLGYYKPNPAAKALVPYQFVAGAGKRRRYEVEPSLFNEV